MLSGVWLDDLGAGLARGVYLLTCWPVRRRTSAENFSLNQARDIKGAFVSSQKSEQAAGLRYGHTACGTLAEIVGRGRFITGCLLHRESA